MFPARTIPPFRCWGCSLRPSQSSGLLAICRILVGEKTYLDSFFFKQINDFHYCQHPLYASREMNSQVDPMIFRFFSGSETPARRDMNNSPASTTVRLISRCLPSVCLTSSHSFRRIQPVSIRMACYICVSNWVTHKRTLPQRTS